MVDRANVVDRADGATGHEALGTTTPGGTLVFHVFAGPAEFIRELIVEGAKGDLAGARARGQHLGRVPALTAK